MQHHNPIGPDRPVFVHGTEWVLEDVVRNGSVITVQRHAPGSRITVAEAERLGIPLLDEQGQPLNEQGQPVAAVVQTQHVKGPAETQDVKPPRRRKART